MSRRPRLPVIGDQMLEMSSNEIRHSQTQERILDAAIEMIEEHGAEGLRVLDVAASAHVGAPTIYYYYSNRSHLVAAAQAERLGRILKSGAHITDDLRKAVEGRERVAFFEAADALSAALWSPASLELTWQLLEIISSTRQDPIVTARIEGVLDAQLATWRDILVAAQDAGWLSPRFDAENWLKFYFASWFGRVAVAISFDANLDGSAAMILKLLPDS